MPQENICRSHPKQTSNTKHAAAPEISSTEIHSKSDETIMVSYSMMEGAEHGLGKVAGSRKLSEEDRKLVALMQKEMGARIISTKK